MDYFNYISRIVSMKVLAGRLKTAENYRCAARSLRRFMCAAGLGGSLPLRKVDGGLMLRFENYLTKEKRMSRNSTSAYMRSLRAAYNKAVAEGMCADRKPFAAVYTGVDCTRKRALDENALRRLLALDLSGSPGLCMTRDMFFFSFLANGMSFVDVAHLRMSDIKGGRICYSRSKTGQPISVKVCAQMAGIIRRYHHKGSDMVFPLIGGGGCRKDYDTALRVYNRGLHKLARLAGIDGGLTSYSARHSWASQAYHLHVPVAVISSCMGHTTEATTRIYLRSLEEAESDRYCQAVIAHYGALWEESIASEYNYNNVERGNGLAYKTKGDIQINESIEALYIDKTNKNKDKKKCPPLRKRRTF
ncbi:MAG: site-specific integrase [Bacteroides sp.]|nr:site-specific integrase [Roseburia sp.]MCM1347536.1 site-specific integrase [Bacteroides sp.]MCM1422023.1 site-specific integrase [Bacteroides sp.]